MHKKSKSGSLLWSLVAVMLALNSLTSEALDRMLFKRKDYFIQFEVWQDDLIHFQVGTHQNPQSPIWVTPSVLVDRWNENTKYQRYLGSLQEEIIETNEWEITI